MTLKKLLLLAAPVVLLPIVLSVSSQGELSAQGKGVAAGGSPQAAGGRLADLFGRLLRQALQRAEADQQDEREEPHAGVGRRAHRGAGRPAASAAVGVAAGHRRRRRHRRLRRRADGTLKGSALVVDGTIYVTMPDNAWALDARDGHELWHYYWKTRGGTHIANRGLGMWNDYLYMETPDNYLVSLDAKTGKERWHKVIADFSLQYFSTTAPIVVDNHVLVGTGNDLDSPGFLQSFDAETGDLQWKFYTVPMNPGDPGLDTWPSLDAARHGGAQPWLPGVYDPETKLYIFGTGNPTPAYTRRPRRGRQSLHVLARRRQRRHRQDGLVLPDLAPRHARLGFGADADPD